MSRLVTELLEGMIIILYYDYNHIDAPTLETTGNEESLKKENDDQSACPLHTAADRQHPLKVLRSKIQIHHRSVIRLIIQY